MLPRLASHRYYKSAVRSPMKPIQWFSPTRSSPSKHSANLASLCSCLPGGQPSGGRPSASTTVAANNPPTSAIKRSVDTRARCRPAQTDAECEAHPPACLRHIASFEMGIGHQATEPAIGLRVTDARRRSGADFSAMLAEHSNSRTFELTGTLRERQCDSERPIEVGTLREVYRKDEAQLGLNECVRATEEEDVLRRVGRRSTIGY